MCRDDANIKTPKDLEGKKVGVRAYSVGTTSCNVGATPVAWCDDPDGCIVRDSVEIEPRLGVLDPIVRWAVAMMFRQRHRKLQRQFG